MKIYTKTGDNGSTSLFGGKRVAKNNLRVNAYGTIDELNAHLGLLIDFMTNDSFKISCRRIQNELFILGSQLATEPEKNNKIKQSKIFIISEQHIEELEREIDKMELVLQPLTNFILPGGHITVSQCHIVRTVARRAEREIITLAQSEEILSEIIKYINRLSDYFFVLARCLSKELGVEEVLWKQ